ncbi:MAG: redoxin domain-containing protein, partial [Bacteroidota bacterium]
MKSRSFLTTAILLAVATGLVFVFGAFGPIANEPAAEVGKAAPAFSLTDLNGNTVSLADFKGKVVVLEWTNPNCPFVQRLYRDEIMTKVQKKYTDKVVWLSVNSTSKSHQDYLEPSALAAKYKEWKADHDAMLMDEDGTVGKMFDAKTTPHMYIIDAKGVLVYNGGIDNDPRGNKSERVNYVDAALDELMAGKAVGTTTS